MLYTAGDWSDTTDMDKACVDKIKNSVDLVDLKSTDKIIDVGCGWGGALDYILNQHPSKPKDVLGITISMNQVY